MSSALLTTQKYQRRHCIVESERTILLGAGSSTPFGIPAMKQFVLNFKLEIASDSTSKGREINDFLGQIELALDESEKLVGTRIPFDLESLMVVLEDLVARKDKPISAPTFALMLHLIMKKRMEVGSYNIKDARRTFSDKAEELLDRLRKFIFANCVKPIEVGHELRNFNFLDLIFAPLFAMIGNGDFKSPRTQWIFTTNWDLCLKQWLDYAMRNIPVEDGTVRDRQGEPVFSPKSWSTTGSDVARNIIPLHGSLGLIKRTKMVRGGSYEEIHKVTAPETYFRGNPSEIAKAFMIFPLEAVGYEQSVRSPYLDMLNLLKMRLMVEHEVFIVGFSLRDSTITSIFEEVLRERAQAGDWQPIAHSEKSKFTDNDIQRFRNMRLKVFLIDSSPETVIRYLKGRDYPNLADALIPIKATFPHIIERFPDDRETVIQDLSLLYSGLLYELKQYGFGADAGDIQNGLSREGLDIHLDYKKQSQV